MLDAVGYIGATVSLVFALVGAGICLRWGLTGVAHIWRRREEIDEVVRRDVETSVLR